MLESIVYNQLEESLHGIGIECWSQLLLIEGKYENPAGQIDTSGLLFDEIKIVNEQNI
jgi:hypothetical protein